MRSHDHKSHVSAHASATHVKAAGHTHAASTSTTPPVIPPAGDQDNEGNASVIIGVAGSAVAGTAGNDHIMAAANDTMTGGGGNDEFVIGASSGSSVITDFGVSGANASIIDLKHSGVASTSFTDLMTHVTEVSGSAVIDLGNGNTLTLNGIDMTSLTAANFELPGSGGHGGHDGGQGGGDHHGGGDDHGGQGLDGGFGGHDHGGMFGFAPAVITGTSISGGGDTLTATAANTIIIAGAGNDTLVAAAGNDQLIAGTGNDSLVGAAGNDIFNGGTGNATMTGGSGNNVFAFSGEHQAFGNAEITNFVTTGNDILRFEGLAGVHSFTDLGAHLTQAGANTVIALDATHSLTLDNVSMSALSAADFVFC